MAFIGLALSIGIYNNYANKKAEEKTEQTVEENLEEKEIQEETKKEIEEDNQDDNKMIIVHITGCVNKEGVYELDQGSRLDQLVDRAGGLTDQASLKSINLAMRLEDEMKVHIPKEGELVEEAPEEEKTSLVSKPNEGSAKSTDGKIDLNKASAEELMTLSGIGEKKAQDIIDYRETNGFNKIEDLLEISGIGEKTFEKLKDSIKVN